MSHANPPVGILGGRDTHYLINMVALPQNQWWKGEWTLWKYPFKWDFTGRGQHKLGAESL